MMRVFRALVITSMIGVSQLALAQTKCGLPDAVLQQMDAASKTFKSAQADLQYDNYTYVVKAHDISPGSIYVERSSIGEQMGAVYYDLGPDGKPGKTPSKVISYDNATLQIYTPGTNQVDVFKAGANRAKYDGFLTLGFGGSGRALCSAWSVQDQGSETLSDGGQPVKTEKLDLTSGDKGVSGMVSHITVWIDPVRDISLKQIIYAPNKDSRTATYTNIRPNQSINKKPYAISKSATRIQH